MLGLPILGYSLDIGKEHVNLVDERIEKLIYSGQLDAKELDRYLHDGHTYWNLMFFLSNFSLLKQALGSFENSASFRCVGIIVF